LKDSVFLHDTQKQQHAKRTPEVECPVGRPKREQRKRNGERKRHHDGKRLQQALELRSEHHVHEYRRQKEREDQIPVRVVENFHSSLELGGISRRQLVFSDDLAHFVGSDVERHFRKRVS